MRDSSETGWKGVRERRKEEAKMMIMKTYDNFNAFFFHFFIILFLLEQKKKAEEIKSLQNCQMSVGGISESKKKGKKTFLKCYKLKRDIVTTFKLATACLKIFFLNSQLTAATLSLFN